MSSQRSRSPAKSPSSLTAAETKLLNRLAAEGGCDASGPAARSLVSRGLAEVRDGRLVASETGRARRARDLGGEEAFLAQHRALDRRTMQTERGPESLLVDLDESPLAWLARRKGRDGKPLLSAAEVAAGERLRADFTRGHMTPRVTANWDAPVANGRRGGAGTSTDLADVALAARARVTRALEAVGPELAGPLVDVCCFLKGLEEVERDRAWPARGAKLVLGLALSRLARHYGFVVSASRRDGRIVSWGAADSRPTIDGV